MLAKLRRGSRRIAYRGWRNSAALDHLRSADNSHAQRLGEALAQVVRSAITPEEAPHLNEVEALRRRLLASDATITWSLFATGQVQPERITQPLREVASFGMRRDFGSLLFRLLRVYRPQQTLELGTSLGISAAYMGKALALNGGGKLTTLEGSPEIAALARENLKALGLDSVSVVTGRFQDTLTGVLDGLPALDVVYIDGHHQKEPTLAYFASVYPHLSPGAVVIFDDINWSADMQDAWRSIQADSRVVVAVDVLRMGLVVVGDVTASTVTASLDIRPLVTRRNAL